MGNNVASCCVRVGSGVQMHAATLGHAVHRGKDATLKTLETMCNAYAWPHPTLLHFTSVISWQSKRNVGSCWLKNFDQSQTLRNNSQQHATTCNIQQCWELLTNNVEFVCMGVTQKNKVLSVTRLLPGPVFINLSLWH